jgi:hypothetical protein
MEIAGAVLAADFGEIRDLVADLSEVSVLGWSLISPRSAFSASRPGSTCRMASPM